MKDFKILDVFETEHGHKGIAMIMSPHQPHINGYLVIEPNSPLYGMNYDNDLFYDNINVNGGITFADNAGKNRAGTFNGITINPDDWVIGFDTVHAWDKPNWDMAKAELTENNTDIKLLDRYRDMYPSFEDDNTRSWGVEDVKNELEKLSEQVAKIENKNRSLK